MIATIQVVGTVEGKGFLPHVGGMSSNINRTEYTEMSSTLQGETYTPYDSLVLKWTERLAEEKSVPLVGGYIYLNSSDPTSAALCILDGDFGPKARASADAVGRTFLFRVTSASMGVRADGGVKAKIDCSGAPMSAAIAGCIYRTNPYLP